MKNLFIGLLAVSLFVLMTAGCGKLAGTSAEIIKGELDLTFDAYSGAKTSAAPGRMMAIDSGGKVYVAGRINNGTDFDIVVVRNNADGSLDTTFGTGGAATYDGGNGDDIGNAIAVDASGNVYVAGQSNNGTDYDILVLKFDENGDLDSTFASTGVYVNDSGGFDYATSIILGPGGSIYVGAGYNSLILKMDSAGVLDSNFGTNGEAAISGLLAVESMVLDGEGKLLVTGRCYVNSFDIGLARLNQDGSMDPTFASGEIVKYVSDLGNDFGQDVAVTSDGKILVAAWLHNGTDWDMAVLRYDNDGSLDTNFRSNGVLSYDGGFGEDIANKLIINANGTIIVAGRSENSSGSSDASLWFFDSSGNLLIDIAASGIYKKENGTGYAVLIDQNSKVLFAGDDSDTNGIFILRLK